MILDLFSIIFGFNLCVALIAMNNYRKELKAKYAAEKADQEFDDLFTTVESIDTMIIQKRLLREAEEILNEDEIEGYDE